MSNFSFALRDSATMLRRDVQHSLRNFSIVFVLLVPIIMLLLLNYVFGGAIGAGLGGVARGSAYIDYLAPGIFVMTVGSGCAATALNLCTDMAEGIVTRFRTMAIFRASVLLGQVLGSLIRTLISVVLSGWRCSWASGPRRVPSPGSRRSASLRCSPSRSHGWGRCSGWWAKRRREPTASPSSSNYWHTPAAHSSARNRCQLESAGSRSFSPSRLSLTRCGGCC